MHTMIKHVVLLAVLMSLAATGFSDTLVLKSGETITGYYEGGTARVIRFRTEDGLKEYDLLSVTRIQFGDEPVSVAGEPKAPEPEPVNVEGPDVRLRTREDSPVVPRSTSAAEGAHTVPTGSVLLVRMIDSIDSEVDRVGQTFTATLAVGSMSCSPPMRPHPLRPAADYRTAAYGGRPSDQRIRHRVALRDVAWVAGCRRAGGAAIA